MNGGQNTSAVCKTEKGIIWNASGILYFWKNLTARLKEWGFEMSPYKWYVASMMINEEQCTILWHVDDIKISHMDATMVTDVIKMLEAQMARRRP